MNDDKQTKKIKFLSETLSILKIFIFALILIIPVKYFLIEPFLVSGASMEPNFYTANYLIINKLKTKTSEIKRGDVLVFVPPQERDNTLWKYSVYFDPRKKYIKRVVGLPKETIKIENNKFYIKKEGEEKFTKLNEPYIKNDGYTNDQELILKNDEYFMGGDNRLQSKDSRVFGPIKKSDIMGEPIIRFLPFNKMSFYPEKYNHNN